MSPEDLRNLLKNPEYNGRKDHFISDCPFCLKERHFYVNLEKVFKKDKKNEYLPSWDCKKCSEKGNAKRLFKQLGALNLLESGKYLGVATIKKLGQKEETEKVAHIALENVKLPLKSSKIDQHEYLNRRGITSYQYEKYSFHTSKLSKFENYVIIPVYQGGRLKAYLARFSGGDDWLRKENRRRKLNGERQMPRWRNLSKAKFSHMLFGLDEIKFNTEWVILVEGIFDKTQTENALELDESDLIKCCSTFGKDISPEQISLLHKKGVKNIILIQDPDALSQTRKISVELEKSFEKVLVGFTNREDLGDSSYFQIREIFQKLKNPMDFQIQIVKSKLLS